MQRTLVTDPIPFRPRTLPDGATVIAPNRAAAAALGVACVSLHSLAKRLLKKNGIGLATPMAASAALKEAVARTHHGGASDLTAAAVARRIRPTLAAILRSGMDIDRLESVVPPRIKPIAAVARFYVAALRKRGLIDSEAALIQASRLECVERQKIFVYGYFRGRQVGARPEEIALIDRIAGDGSVYFLPCGGDAVIFGENKKWRDRLLATGWSEAETAASGSSGPDPQTGTLLAAAFAANNDHDDNLAANESLVEALAYPSIESEVRGTLSRAKHAVLSGTPPSEIAVVCRDIDLYAPLIASTADEYQLPVEIEHDVPIAATAFGEFVSLVFDVIGASAQPASESKTDRPDRSFQFEPTTRLLRHPFGPRIEDPAWSEARRQHPSRAADWVELAAETKYLQVAGERTIREWTDWLRGVMFAWSVRNSAALSSCEIVAYNNFFDSLEQVVSESREDKPCGINRFAGEVFEILTDVKTPFRTEVGGVRVMQPNSIVGGEFESVFVLGMAEGILPAPSSDDAVIDFHERNRLREKGVEFEDAFEVPRWETATFYFTLLAAQKSVVLSYPQFIDGGEYLKSSYFERLGVEPRPASRDFVSSRQEKRRAILNLTPVAAEDDEVLAAARRHFDIEQRRHSGEAYDEYDGVIGVPFDPAGRAWSASSLTTIGSCPFKWLAERVLWLSSPEDADADLPASTKGSLYHKTLELAVRRAMSEPKDFRTAVLENLESAFAEAEASDDISLKFVANWELRREEHLEKLRFAVASEDFIAEGAKVVALEREFEAEWFGLRVRGRIDRVDETADGKLVAVDYKTGSYAARVKDESGKLRLDLQLPIYSGAALPSLYPGRETAEGIYIRLAKGEAEKEKPVALEPVAESIKSILREGRFAVDPDVDQNACRFCETDPVCRRGPRLARKHNITE